MSSVFAWNVLKKTALFGHVKVLWTIENVIYKAKSSSLTGRIWHLFSFQAISLYFCKRRGLKRKWWKRRTPGSADAHTKELPSGWYPGVWQLNIKKAAESFEIALFFCQEICFIL